MSRRLVGTLKTNNYLALCARQNQIPRCFSTTSQRQDTDKTKEANDASEPHDAPKKDGAMARRLAEMTEDAMLEGGRSARKNMQEAGFSDDLKRELEERIAASAFKSDHAAAHSIVDMPTYAGQGTQDTAAAQPWSGTENLHDVTLRMLDSSAPKPMRTPYKIPQPNPVDMRIAPKPKKTPGNRLAEAKERTSAYAMSQDTGLSDHEREKFRNEMKERFTFGARPMPVSVQGFASLANERIENAMARGQFDKIKRGKGVNTETDHNANSAFIDTTEYFMNKIIQKQEIVPPWIEKQQDLARDINRFRERLRTEWRRHAARLIASSGGSLEAQMRRAEAYAAAEVRLAENAKAERSLREGFKDGGKDEPLTSSESPTPSTEEGSSTPTPEADLKPGHEDANRIPHVSPLRDPDYLSIERSFYELTIKTLNSQTRSYNLQAPPVAQKPYLTLERELSACYADVAPTLAEEIRRRATERAHRPVSTKSRATGVLDSLSTSSTVHVYEEDQAKGYGFKQFWRDIFSKKE